MYDPLLFSWLKILEYTLLGRHKKSIYTATEKKSSKMLWNF